MFPSSQGPNTDRFKNDKCRKAHDAVAGCITNTKHSQAYGGGDMRVSCTTSWESDQTKSKKKCAWVWYGGIDACLKAYTKKIPEYTKYMKTQRCVRNV
jgi:hypothetical protein